MAVSSCVYLCEMAVLIPTVSHGIHMQMCSQGTRQGLEAVIEL